MIRIFKVAKRFFCNVIFLLKFDLNSQRKDAMSVEKKCAKNSKDIEKHANDISKNSKDISKNSGVISKLFFNEINFYYDLHKKANKDVKAELDFLRKEGKLCNFPYQRIEFLKDVKSGFDEKRNLAFVVHNGKRLYFSKNFTEKTAADKYKYYIERENLLGGKIVAMGGGKMPHEYQGGEVCVENDDVLLDIGCAEALFALDNVEKVKKIYLFESNKIWYDALEATFAPFKEKVILIKKSVSDTDGENSTTLETALSEEKDSTFFLKMDIEGAEEKVIEHSKTFLTVNKVKIAACTYHLFDAQEKIPNLLETYGYKGNFSEGYMLFYMYDYRPPFFRKGVYRAKNF